MINLNKPSRPFYQWRAPILLFALFTIWLNLTSLAHAATPPGLPVLNAKQDAFSILLSGLRSNTNLKKVLANIDVLGTKKETLSYSSPQNIYALSITGSVGLNSNTSAIKVVFIDNATQKEYLVYETYPVLTDNSSFDIQEVCEETCLLPQIASFSLRIEVTDAFVSIRELSYADKPIDGDAVIVKANQDQAKIQKLNAQKLGWIAGETSVSKLTYEQKKHLFLKPEVPNLQGFEYYRGGVFEIQSTAPGNDRDRETRSSLVNQFDWRDRHGENWITPVKDQGVCGSCWAFSVAGTIEAVTNLYFNQHLDLDLAEQDALSCSGMGNCEGGATESALGYFATTSLVGEACFPYTATDQACSNKCGQPTEAIQISGKFTSEPRTEENFKRLIIENGPASASVHTLTHAMTLVGFQTDDNDSRTVWIFKNSWGKNWGGSLHNKWGEYWADGHGDNGYAYVKLALDNMSPRAVQTPIISLQPRQINCIDKDNDGYCNWGIAKDKPATCPASCKLEKDCDDSNPTAGPFDANYNCGGNVLPTTKQFNIFNDGDAELLVSSIIPEISAPWISVTPSTFSVPAKGTQMVTVQMDYTQAPAGRSATRLLVNSNDPDETPFPNGVNIVVERPNLTTTGTLASPILGEPVALSASDSPVNTTSKFSGGIAVNNQSLLQQVILHLSDKVDVRGEITVDFAHIGQPAALFVYAEATFPGSDNVHYYMLENGLNILEWDQKTVNLATFMPVTLGTTQTVPMYQGTFFYPGTLKVYFGYRLTDGTVVSSGQPIDITILP